MTISLTNVLSLSNLFAFTLFSVSIACMFSDLFADMRCGRIPMTHKWRVYALSIPLVLLLLEAMAVEYFIQKYPLELLPLPIVFLVSYIIYIALKKARFALLLAKYQEEEGPYQFRNKLGLAILWAIWYLANF